MPKRVGFLWEKMVAEENCIAAEVVMGKNKPDNRVARHIAAHPEPYAKALREKLVNGYVFSAPRCVSIKDSYKGKTRDLKIPCLEDQAAMQAWLNIATPYIEKRNYYYNCGSIPGAGQTRAANGLKRILKRRKNSKWAAVTDIRKFYDTCRHEVVLTGLRRLFKDERFVDFAKRIMDSMSGSGIGLAIGFPVSHWLANVALMWLDHDLCRLFPEVRHFRYMDDVPFVASNKRKLRKALLFYMEAIRQLGMVLKRSWQVFPVIARGILFLSYRFFHGFTVLAKPLMYRISRRIRMASHNLTARAAAGVMSYLGILRHCNSHSFYIAHVVPYVNPKKCRRVISYASKNLLRCAA